MERKNLLIYIPAFNEEKYIANVIKTLPSSLDGINTINILVIDDGSQDSTRQVAAQAGAKVISHPRNKGVGAAFHTSVKEALTERVDILVGIDADGQFNPDEIPNLIAPILHGTADMVTGNRFSNGKPTNMSAIKFWGNNAVSKLISFITEQRFQDVSCGYRAYSREALLWLNLFGEFTYTHETILDLVYKGLSVVEYPIEVKYFPERKSRVAKSLRRYALQTIKIVFRTLIDYKSMRVFGAVGFLSFLTGTLFEVFLVGHYILNGAFTPYKSFGFIGLGFIIFGLFVFLFAFIADMINRLRKNQEVLLYEIKKDRENF